MNAPALPTIERDLSDLDSARRFLDEMAELLLAFNPNLPPTIDRDADGTAMHVLWHEQPPMCAHIVVQTNNGSMGSLWLDNTPGDERFPDGYVCGLTAHVGIAVGQLLTKFGLG